MVFKKSDLQDIFRLFKDGKSFKDFENLKVTNVLETFDEKSFKKLNSYIEDINSYKDTNKLFDKDGNNTQEFNGLLDSIKSLGDEEITKAFKDFANNADKATMSLEDLFAVKLDGNTHGLKNIKGILNEFNEYGADEQLAFASAVGQSNKNLGDYLNTVKGGKASLGGYVGSLVKTTAKTVALELATAALNGVLMVGATLLINAMVQSITETINAYDNAIDKVEEYKNSIESINENLNTLNKDLSENIKKLRELEQIENPTLYEQDQIDGLKEVNAELTRQIKLNEYELELKEKEYRLEAQRAYKITQFDKTWINDAFDEKENASWIDHVLGVATAGGWWNVRNAVSNTSNAFQGNLFSQNEKDLEEYKKTVEEYKHIQQLFVKGAWYGKEDQYNKLIESYKKNIGNLEIKLSGFRNEMQTLLLALDPTSDKEKIAQIEDFINTYDDFYNRMNNPNYKNFTSVYENTQFADITAELNALAASGKLNEETFGNVDGIEKFIDALKSAGVDTENVEEIIRAIENAISNNSDATVDGALNIDNLTASYQKFNETLKDSVELQDELASVFEKVANGVELTKNEVIELLNKFPSLINYLSSKGDGYTFELNGIEMIYDNLSKPAKEDAQKIIDDYEKALNAVKRYEDAQNTVNSLQYKYNLSSEEKMKLRTANQYISDSNSQSMYQDALNILTNDKDKYDNAITLLAVLDDELDTHSLIINGLASQYNDAKDKIDGYNDSIKTIDSAIDKMNSKQALSYDEMVELIEINPDLVNAFNKQEDGYYIAIDALEDLRKQSFETRNDYIDDLIAMEKATLTSKRNTYTALLGIINSYVSDEARNKAIEDIKAITAEINATNEFIEKLSGLKGEIYPDDTTGSTNDPITTAFEKELKYLDYLRDMGMISAKEYYKQLYFLNEKYYSDNADYLEQYRDNEVKIRDGITDIEIRAIDRQIEALEALKEKREEEKELQELQIELEEKKLELLNKQSQKNVRYYDAEKREWVWTYNRNDVADAQKTVDEAQEALDEHLYQSNEDKKIEQLEQIKEILQGDEDNPNNPVQFVGSEGVTTKATGRSVTFEEFVKSLGATQPIDTTKFWNAIYSTGLQPNVQKIAESTHNQNYQTVNRNVTGNTINVTVNGSNLSADELSGAIENGVNDALMDLANQLWLKS